jgi:hypothetical protein
MTAIKLSRPPVRRRRSRDFKLLENLHNILLKRALLIGFTILVVVKTKKTGYGFIKLVVVVEWFHFCITWPVLP